MKIAHISDTHLGYSQYKSLERKKDFLVAFEEAIKTAISEKVDVIIHTGDLFEDFKPDIDTLNFVAKILDYVKGKKIPFIAIPGNHDRPLRSGAMPPQQLFHNLGLMIMPRRENNFMVEIDGVLFAGMPYLPQRLLGEFLKSGKMSEVFSEEAQKYRYSVFMFHQGISPIAGDSMSEATVEDLPPGFTYYAGGHIHKYTLDKIRERLISYAGSTEYRNRSEVSYARGFNIVELPEGNVKRVELQGLREFIVLKANETNIKEELQKLCDRLPLEKPPIVIIEYTFKTRDISDFGHLLEEIEGKSLVLKIEKRLVKSEEELVAPQRKGKTLGEFLEIFVEKQLDGTEEEIKVAREIWDAHPNNVPEIIKSYLGKFLSEAPDDFRTEILNSIE